MKYSPEEVFDELYVLLMASELDNTFDEIHTAVQNLPNIKKKNLDDKDVYLFFISLLYDDKTKNDDGRIHTLIKKKIGAFPFGVITKIMTDINVLLTHIKKSENLRELEENLNDVLDLYRHFIDDGINEKQLNNKYVNNSTATTTTTTTTTMNEEDEKKEKDNLTIEIVGNDNGMNDIGKYNGYESDLEVVTNDLLEIAQEKFIRSLDEEPDDGSGLNENVSRENIKKLSNNLGMSQKEVMKHMIYELDNNFDKDSMMTKLMEFYGFDHVDYFMSLIDDVDKSISHLKKLSSPPPPDHSKSKKRRNKKKCIGFSVAEYDDFDYRKKKEDRVIKIDNMEGDMMIRDLQERKLNEKTISYPFVWDRFRQEKFQDVTINRNKLSLPSNHLRYEHPEYEEITLPSIGENKDKAMKDKELDIIVGLTEGWKKTDEIEDEHGKKLFSEIKKLNRIQSVVFDAAFNSIENLLICAPTGAGKTNIAMLAIANEVRRQEFPAQFKIVYIAPMKALAREMVETFRKRFFYLVPETMSDKERKRRAEKWVREWTGDIQLTQMELLESWVLVTTPEKWDVVTRKPGLQLEIKLLIIDEVHLLHEVRGAVIEAIVARTLRTVESRQTHIRLVGLSATLPNYLDVAEFLHVNPMKGLFFFDDRFRPVPLSQTFIGIRTKNFHLKEMEMVRQCYEKALYNMRQGHQVMIFVHSRNATVKTIEKLIELIQIDSNMELFKYENVTHVGYRSALKYFENHNRKLGELFQYGMAVHHAGLVRSDRTAVENAFRNGYIRLLACTATLAWGVNLPVHTVIIKGTDVYNQDSGQFEQLSILDVLQIFGRAGRPQYDSEGYGIIITDYSNLYNYIRLLLRQNPIESKLLSTLVDKLNGEISLGTVSSVTEAVHWLSYTYLQVRMRKNPMLYGMTLADIKFDPDLSKLKERMIIKAAVDLDKSQMIRFDQKSQYLSSTAVGRTAALYYISYETICTFNDLMKDDDLLSCEKMLGLLSASHEFKQLRQREDEGDEIEQLRDECCEHEVEHFFAGSDDGRKVNTLIQLIIGRGESYIRSFSLISDCSYIKPNLGRIARAYFEMALSKNWPQFAAVTLNMCKLIEKRLWNHEHPLRQFMPRDISFEICKKLENKKMTLDRISDMEKTEISAMLDRPHIGATVKLLGRYIPSLKLETKIQPVTPSILRITINFFGDFEWNDRFHGKSQGFWFWIEDFQTTCIYHHEHFSITREQVKRNEELQLIFTIPLRMGPKRDGTHYCVRCMSDNWVGRDVVHSIDFHLLKLPNEVNCHTELLLLQCLPKQVLNLPKAIEEMYSFDFFNPIQTQIFHTLYHTNYNALVGAPTGSGKTVAAELAIFHAIYHQPDKNKRIVYIAPLKALARERYLDWKKRLPKNIGVVEMTGDSTPDMDLVRRSRIIVTTPEKWDAVSRSWQQRSFVQSVILLVIDEIHILGEDRGPVLEVIVSRTNFISQQTGKKIRVVGLSTALANPHDLANWLGITDGKPGLYNFRPAVRPIPLQIHIEGFSGKNYCPRMASMNRPCFKNIQIHGPNEPVLIFVSSRRQTRITAMDLMTQKAALTSDSGTSSWMKMCKEELDEILSLIHDSTLQTIIRFGVGIHHAGLVSSDRDIVQRLFVEQKIQILVATSTLAWGVNYPAHLVIVKGTEYYDGKSHRYVDFPITDVLQMIGRAGRPQFTDREGIAVVMVHDIKKQFYQKFLHEPFPIESSLLEVLPDHLNAEIAAQTITSKQSALKYLTWTYFYRRLINNPLYYELCLEDETIDEYLTRLINDSCEKLKESECIEIEESKENENNEIIDYLYPTSSGHIASYYYLKHITLRIFKSRINSQMTYRHLLELLCDATEFNELPVRHNEDTLNQELARELPYEINPLKYDNSNTKAFILLQAHLSHSEMPSSDYKTDLKTVLDNALRVAQGLLDLVVLEGWLDVAINCIYIQQTLIQASWLNTSDLLTMPHIETQHLHTLLKNNINSLPALKLFLEGNKSSKFNLSYIFPSFSKREVREIEEAVKQLPNIVQFSFTLKYQRKTINFRPDTHSNRYFCQFSYDESDEDLLLNITVSQFKTHSFPHKIYAPHFPKSQVDSSITIISRKNELLTLKRSKDLTKIKRMNLSFPFDGYGEYGLTIFSSTYIGFDHEYELIIERA
ncbi:hypothetical protein SNEBB_006718 [Seison nebaliae]|nr:hypothetical protein SNEBB_006718 [Seison nebaliae]